MQKEMLSSGRSYKQKQRRNTKGLVMPGDALREIKVKRKTLF
jgi:hypothetical protein